MEIPEDKWPSYIEELGQFLRIESEIKEMPLGMENISSIRLVGN